jgi:hypothetical protein
MVHPAAIDIHAHDEMGYTRPVDVVPERLRLNRADQRRILGATAAGLLRLG